MARGDGKRQKKSDEALGQSDPAAPLDSAAFLAAATPVLAILRDNLLARAKENPAIDRALAARHAREVAERRTADSLVEFRERTATQVAAAWLLSCVFVRTLEDRGLLATPRLAGPGAMDSQALFFELAPSLSERDYLQFVFRELATFPAARALFHPEHSLIWRMSPSADAAKALVGLFRAPTADAPAFRFGQASTRFLGDLYQDLDEGVRKRFALLQTPDFIESYLLDQTLEPAIERFGLAQTTLIDPTCGSGHFLLGAFARLFEQQLRAAPNIGRETAAQAALDQIFGADINPYAVAIARFRLTLAYLEAVGHKSLASAPALPLHIAVGDSLLHNPHGLQMDMAQLPCVEAKAFGGELFALEDEVLARDVLHRQYAAVVGNPPYITVKDATLRDVYRGMYPRSAFRSYSLAAPFCERFFQLGKPGALVGQITANSFMKREFGRKLIEDFLPTINLTGIANLTDADIPGHTTPTLLLLGSVEPPQNSVVSVVLAKRGEAPPPQVPANGLVWRSIADNFPGGQLENDYVSVVRIERANLVTHPWSLGGGGSMELKELLEERAENRLSDLVDLVGFGAVTREDDVFVLPKGSSNRWRVPDDVVLPYVMGEAIRDWSIAHESDILFPYDRSGTLPAERLGRYAQILWCYREQLWNRQGKGFKTKREAGGEYFEYSMFYPDRHFAKWRIAFPFVATHNHFVLDRGGKVFNRTAPVIKLPVDATEDDHYALLAYLNSSTACFWMKQVAFQKSSANFVGEGKNQPERIAYEFTGTQLQLLPVFPASHQAVELARRLDSLATQRRELQPTALLRASKPSPEDFLRAEEQDEDLRNLMVALQEELDWEVYVAAGLAPEELLARKRDIDLERARSFRHARPFQKSVDAPVVEPAALSSLWQERAEFIHASETLSILEAPMFKRPWLGAQGAFHRDEWTYQELRVLAERDAQLDQCERAIASEREPCTQGIIARSDAQGDLFNGALLAESSVPYLAALRYSHSGMAKYALWESSWESQRKEDSGEIVDVTVPPKYLPKDFLRGTYYSLRGKLDVPKERFISYPGCESDEDGQPVYGWAGWDHLQRAQALAALYMKRKTDEQWGAARLTPMLAGVLELLPWVRQWHNEPSDEFGGLRMGEYFADFLAGELAQLGLTEADLRAWRPTKKSRGKRKPKSA